MKSHYDRCGEIYLGDALTVLRSLPDGIARTCVTSPPYWGLRDYGVPGQLGLEPAPEKYVARMVEVFREVRRVLRDDGTLWLNLGDSYATGAGRAFSPGGGAQGEKYRAMGAQVPDQKNPNSGIPVFQPNRMPIDGLKPKDLVGIPWRVAFALQADGWWLRSDIIWAKPNPMPESVADRPTKAHEYLFLLSKSARYYYDPEAIAEPLAESSIERITQPDLAGQWGSDRVPGKTSGTMKAVPPRFGGAKYGDSDAPEHRTKSGKPYLRDAENPGLRNARTVWTICTQPLSEAHFATFPEELPRRCILAGSREGDTVLDPFFGAGTTGLVAAKLRRRYLGIELNSDYAAMAARRIAPIAAQEVMAL